MNPAVRDIVLASAWTPRQLGRLLRHCVEDRPPSLPSSLALGGYFNVMADRSPYGVVAESAGTLTSRPQYRGHGVEVDAGFFGLSPSVSFGAGVAFTMYGVLEVVGGGLGVAYPYAHSTLLTCLFQLNGDMILAQDDGDYHTVVSPINAAGLYGVRLRRLANGATKWKVTAQDEVTGGSALAGAWTFDTMGGRLGGASAADWGFHHLSLATGDAVADGWSSKMESYLADSFGVAW